MTDMPSAEALEAALAAAGSSHHEFETHYLNGMRDELWPGYYAAYVLGRLGDFARPTDLARWLAEVTAAAGWPAVAATHVRTKLAAR